MTTTSTVMNVFMVESIRQHFWASIVHAKKQNSCEQTDLLQNKFIPQAVIDLTNRAVEDVFLITPLDNQSERIRMHSFTCRGNLTAFAETIIRTCIMTSIDSLIVIRIHKSGKTGVNSRDQQLVRHLLSGFNLLEIKLVDYVILANDELFSAREEGLFPKQSCKNVPGGISLVPAIGGI